LFWTAVLQNSRKLEDLYYTTGLADWLIYLDYAQDFRMGGVTA